VPLNELCWDLWEAGEVLEAVQLDGALTPLLACWEKKGHPAQIRLQAYLETLAGKLGALPTYGMHLFLHMDIDVGKAERLLTHYDLENYLTPVVYRLGHIQFCLASARKYVGGGSRLTIGRVQRLSRDLAREGWGHFSCHAGSGVTNPTWKKNIYDQLAQQVLEPLPPKQPIAAHLAWQCAAPDKRNWVGLWKTTGDAMGPVLGWPQKEKQPFNPYDDRIVSLHLHRNVDETMGHAVNVGMWWRPIGHPEG
jgi:hypothetical protein